MSDLTELAAEVEQAAEGRSRGSLGVALLRIVLGIITLLTWVSNIEKDFYDGDNFAGFFDWVRKPAEEGGNGATLGFVQSLVDGTLLQAPELFGWLMTFFELGIALALILGVFTRAASLAATAFFGSLFLVYFGGEEWMGTYALLTASAFTIFLSWGGRVLGVDQFLAKRRGESPLTLLW